MNKNLEIDLGSVNSNLQILENKLEELNSLRSSLPTSFGEGWSSVNAKKVNEELDSFGKSIDSIRESIGRIKAAVGQYSTNVSEVDSSVNLNTKAN